MPKEINDGAQYLLIDKNPFTNGIYAGEGMFPMGCAVPNDILYINDSLSKELINFLKFKSGHTFDSDPYSTEDGWSKMIWDLLSIASFQYSKRKNAGIRSFPRGNEYNHFYTEHMEDITLLEEAAGIFENMGETLDENRGVSVVVVESRFKGAQEENTKVVWK